MPALVTNKFRIHNAKQFVEAFDRIIEIEKKSAIEIKELKSKDLNITKEIEFVIQQVEDLKRKHAQDTCLARYIHHFDKLMIFLACSSFC